MRVQIINKLLPCKKVVCSCTNNEILLYAHNITCTRGWKSCYGYTHSLNFRRGNPSYKLILFRCNWVARLIIPIDKNIRPRYAAPYLPPSHYISFLLLALLFVLMIIICWAFEWNNDLLAAQVVPKPPPYFSGQRLRIWNWVASDWATYLQV